MLYELFLLVATAINSRQQSEQSLIRKLALKFTQFCKNCWGHHQRTYFFEPTLHTY